MKKILQQPFAIIILFLGGFLFFNYLRNELLSFIADDNTITLSTKYLIDAAFDIFFTIVSYLFIKNYKLIDLAGLGKQKLKNWFLLLFPLYIVLINIPEPGEIDYGSIPAINYLAAFLWVLGVGLSEEFMLRGVVQGVLLKFYATSKTKVVLSVVGAAVIFGLLHLVKFDKGIYGELTQVVYATFIGTMFGALLLRTHKIWPLVLLHALIDLSGNLEKFQSTETTINSVSQSEASLEDSLVIMLVLLPSFIYGLMLLRKVKVDDVRAKIEGSVE